MWFLQKRSATNGGSWTESSPLAYKSLVSSVWFSTWGDFAPQGTLVLPGDMFGCPRCVGDATGICWVETREVAQHPAMHRTATHNNYRPQIPAVLRLRNPDLSTMLHCLLNQLVLFFDFSYPFTFIKINWSRKSVVVHISRNLNHAV